MASFKSTVRQIVAKVTKQKHELFMSRRRGVFLNHPEVVKEFITATLALPIAAPIADVPLPNVPVPVIVKKRSAQKPVKIAKKQKLASINSTTSTFNIICDFIYAKQHRKSTRISLP